MAAAAVLAPAAGASGAPWVKIETPDVIVYGNVSKRNLLEFAVGYAAFRHTFNVLLTPVGVRPPPSTVLLFRDLSDLRAHLDAQAPQAKEVVSVTTPVDDHALLGLALAGDRDQALATAFEFDTVWELQHCGFILPLWMTQGTGEVLSTIRLSGGASVVGEIRDACQRVMDRHDPIPWPHFFQIGTRSPDYRGKPGSEGLYQAQAWGLMDEILFSGSSFRDQFDRLARLEQAGLSEIGTDADLRHVATVLGIEPSGVSDAVRRGRHRGMSIKVPFDDAGFRAKFAVVAAPMAEVHVQLAEMAIGVGNGVDSDYELSLASSLAPQTVMVKEAEARSELRLGDTLAAVGKYRLAIALGSTDSKAFLASAAQRLDDGRLGAGDTEAGGGPELPHALEEIRQAMRLSAGDGYAYLLLGRAYFISPTITEANAEELSPAVRDPSYGLSVRFYRGMLYRRLRHLDLFEADMRFILSSPAASESIKRVAARSLAAAPAAADLEPILELVTEHRYPEAEAKLKEEIARQGDSSLATDYAALLGRIEDEEAIQGMRQLYLAGKWHELFDAASRYLDDTGSGKVRYREEAAEYKADASRHFGDGAGLSERAASTSPQAQKPARNGP